MQHPKYPRTKKKLGSNPPDPMELPPLFSNQSPWNKKVEGSTAFPNGVIPESDNQRVMLVAFDVMRELSWEVLAKDYQKLDEDCQRLHKLEKSGPLSDPDEEAARVKEIDKLRGKIDNLRGEDGKPGRIERLHAALKTDKGLDRGGIQTPHIECVDYAFPIYPVQRLQNGERPEVEIPMNTYYKETWKPAYSNRRSEGVYPNETWFAAGVPLPAGEFRPALPQGNDSDGTIILYDPIAHEEWDFFQVTTSHDPKQSGSGHEGTKILEAGSLAKFDTKGMGARVPPDGEPLGSSRATGLPYLGGLLVPEDFLGWETSVITHALAFAFPRSRYFPFRNASDPPDYIYPAVKTETKNFIQNPFALASGMRIRLKSVIKCADGRELPIKEWNKLPHAVRIFFTALHDYGAYLVDGAFGFGFAAEDRETAVIDPDMVPQLSKKPTDAKITPINLETTPWESLLQTIDNYLNWELFPAGVKLPNGKESAGFGLSLGCLNHTDDGYSFWTNFEVVAPLKVPT